MCKGLNIEFIQLFGILNGDDVASCESFIAHQIIERVGFDVQPFDGIVTVDIARCSYGNNMRTFGQNFEGDWTVNFAFGISMEIHFGQLFRVEFLSGYGITTCEGHAWWFLTLTRGADILTEFLEKRNNSGELEDDPIRRAVRMFDRKESDTAAVEGQPTEISIDFGGAFVTTEGVFPFLERTKRWHRARTVLKLTVVVR